MRFANLIGLLALVLVVALVAPRWAPGQAAGGGTARPAGAAAAQSAEPSQAASFLEIIAAGGVVGAIIILLSVAGLALVLEHAFSIRAAVLAPPGLADQVREALHAGQLTAATQLCQQSRSPLATVIASGLAEVEGGWAAVEKASEDALAEQSARLFRKVDYLSVIGNIAPMLGLLGTVIGMVMAFREVAATQGAARAADLAEGIYLALVTTVEGLVVAIPAMAAFAFFRNRVDQSMAEVAYGAQHAFTPLRRGRVVARRPGAPPLEGRP